MINSRMTNPRIAATHLAHSYAAATNARSRP
jgi:hypothetical protein